MTRESIFRELVAAKNKQDSYIRSIPSDINGAIYDNEYVNSLNQVIDMLIEHVFQEHSESVYWFLYDWKPNYHVAVNDVTKPIATLDDYIKFMQEHENF